MKRQLLIGTNNPGKKKHWEEHLSDFELFSPDMFGINDVPEEGMMSLIENAKHKARFYMERSGILSFSNDVGFYIPDLNSLPGVAVRRWGGELPDTVSDEDWMEYFYSQITSLEKEEIHAYFKWAIALAEINGNIQVITEEIHGIIHMKYFENKDFDKGYPIGNVFVPEGFNKVWSKLDNEERKRRDAGLVEKFQMLLNSKII
ncbi:MAG: non-canonical purine NTP pyrophosphatase [Candidatus Gracilibacteria bacterium]